MRLEVRLSQLSLFPPVYLIRYPGLVISSYEVENRIQVEVFDPAMYNDDNMEDDIPCPICREPHNLSDHINPMILCDECDMGYHIHCVGFESVPRADWFCETCLVAQEERRDARASTARMPHHAMLHLQRTREAPRSRLLEVQQQHIQREQPRIQRAHPQSTNSEWVSIWRSVFGSREAPSDYSLREWHRRRVAATTRDETCKPAVTWQESRPREIRLQPKPETKEEIVAWNVFEVAKAIDKKPTANRKAANTPQSGAWKRKLSSISSSSSSSSPSDAALDPAPTPQPERPLKRPRTRRAPGLNEPFSSLPRFNSRLTHNEGRTSNSPSFLRSLLKEVESSPPPPPNSGHGQARSPPSESNFAQVSSPGVSPTPSNRSSPRPTSTTPPPSTSARPGSPGLLTSNIEPRYPPPEFSPERSPASPSFPLYYGTSSPEPATQNPRTSRPRVPTLPLSSSPRSKEASPHQRGMSLEVKTELSMIVKGALQSPWKKKLVTKDQYTEINRSVSRILYERIGQVQHMDKNARESGQRMAREEVEKSLRALAR